MLDTLSDSELRVALAAVEEHRQTTSKAQREKALLDAGDWGAIEAYLRSITRSPEAVVPWGVYTKANPHSHPFFRVRCFGYYREEHPMAPVLAKGSRECRMNRWRSMTDYASVIWLRWASISKLTWFPGDPDKEVPRYKRGVRHKNCIMQRPDRDFSGGQASMWLRGQWVDLTREQVDVIKQMYAVIDAFDNPRDRVKAMQAWKTKRFTR